MTNISKDEIISSSRGWIASLLNFLPGLGAGYLYQRRWIPYFLTAAALSAWLAIGIIFQEGEEPTQTEQLIGISGLFFISIVTAIEANLAYRKAVNKAEAKLKETKTSVNKGWFK